MADQHTIQLVSSPVEHVRHAHRALGCVLDAEIEALKGRLLQRSANAAVACGLTGADRDRQIGWLRESLTKLQARRGALC